MAIGPGRPRRPLRGIRMTRADPWSNGTTPLLRAIANALRLRALNYRARKQYRSMVNLSNIMWKAGAP